MQKTKELEQAEKRVAYLEKLAVGPSGAHYAISRVHGFLISFDRGESWHLRSDGLPKKIVWPFEDDELDLLTAVGIDPLREGSVAITTPDKVFVSNNFGLEWEEVLARSIPCIVGMVEFHYSLPPMCVCVSRQRCTGMLFFMRQGDVR